MADEATERAKLGRTTGSGMTPGLAMTILSLYEERGMTVREIAFKVGMNEGRVREVIDRAGWLSEERAEHEQTVLIDRHDDPYAWLMEQVRAVKQRRGIDYAGLAEFIEEAAGEIMLKATSQMTNLMAHVMKVIHTRNPEVIGHWRSEITQFQVQIADAYRPSMRQRIDLEKLWRRSRKLVVVSFKDHGEPLPDLPDECPFTIDMLTDEDLAVEDLIRQASGGRFENDE